MTTPTRPDTHDMLRDLTQPHQHREPYESHRNGTTWTGWHTTHVPALITQLIDAAPSSTLDQMGTAFGSRPAAPLESIDTVMLIDNEAGEWLNVLGELIPTDKLDPHTQRTIRGTGTIATLRKLGGLHPSLKTCGAQTGHRDDTGAWCCQRHHLEHDIRHWWHQARLTTGWDTAAFRPHNTCPVCEQWDSLRIRPDAALCVECRSIWDGNDQLNILALHIQAENGDEPALATA